MYFTWYFRSSEPRWFFNLKTDLHSVADALAAACSNPLDTRAAN